MDARRFAAATDRNREPLLAILRRVLPDAGLLLEVASGTGQHAAFFARHLPGLAYQPTDLSPESLASVDAWAQEAALPNLRPALRLDARAERWPVEAADAVLAINMIHISPWAATVGLFAGAARLLPAGGPLVTYGPYKVGGAHTAPSNAAFDADLRRRDPHWGVRDVGDLETLAAEHGFGLAEQLPMPANNLTLVFRRR